MRNLRFVTGMASAAILILLGSLASAAVDNSYVPAAGGNWDSPADWSLGHNPTSANNALIEVSGNAHKAVYYNAGSASVDELRIDGSAAGYYGALWHLQDSLIAEVVYLGDVGEAWHWMESDAFLWSLGNLYVGYQDPGDGHFYMYAQDYGVIVNGISYVGYQGEGDFDHLNGYHFCNHLYIGQNAPGTYWLKGPEETSTLNPEYHIVVGNGDVGLFEQTGGTVVNDSSFSLYLGLNSGGEGTYKMKGGTFNAHHISIAFNGDGYFTQSGGTVNTESNVNIGCEGDNPYRAWYKLNEDDGTAALNIGGNLNVGQFSLAKYEQTSGTATVAGNLNIYEDPNSGTYSYVYLGTSAGLLEINGAATNHSGYYDQDGGVFSAPSFTNDSSSGFNLDNSADFRATNVTHNDGGFYMWRNAIVRGELWSPPDNFLMCNFTNNATVQMGNVSFDGGTFVGHMTNNGSFNYGQGDFSASTLTNYGTVYLDAPFTCNRFVQNAYSFVVYPSAPVTATGAGYANAFESNGNLTIHDGAYIQVIDAPLVSNDPMYAGGSVYGDVESNAYLLPAIGSATDEFYIDGDFTQSSAGNLRIRLGGTMPITDFDRVRLTGHATLGGTLDVRLIDGFTPSLGDTFRVVIYNGGHTGQFTNEQLPALPDGLEWDVRYLSGLLQLDVIEEQECPGDLNGDGVIDLSDLAQLLAHFGQSGMTYEQGDINGDGYVDLSDLAALLAVFDTTCP